MADRIRARIHMTAAFLLGLCTVWDVIEQGDIPLFLDLVSAAVTFVFATIALLHLTLDRWTAWRMAAYSLVIAAIPVLALLHITLPGGADKWLTTIQLVGNFGAALLAHANVPRTGQPEE